MDSLAALRLSLLDLRARIGVVLDRIGDQLPEPPPQTRNVIGGSFLKWSWTPRPDKIGLEHPPIDVAGVKLQYSRPGQVPVIHGSQVGTLHSCFITGQIGAQSVTLIMDLEPKYAEQQTRYLYSLLVDPTDDPREWLLTAVLVNERS